MSLQASVLEEVDAILREAKVDRQKAYQARANKILSGNGAYEERVVVDLFKMLDAVRTSLLGRISSLNVKDEFEVAHLQSLRAMVDEAALQLSTRFGNIMQTTLGENWAKGISDTNQLLQALVGDLHNLPLQVSTDQLLVAQQVGSDLVVRVTREFQAQAKQRISMGILGQKSAFGVMTDIGNLLKTQPTRQDPSLGPIAYQAERIVRTETNGIYALANQVRHQQITEVVPDVRKQWIPAHDKRVRPAHVEAGRHYAPGGDPGPIPFDEDYIVGGEHMRFPHDPNSSAKNRINCRCISILYRKEWFDGTEAATS